MAVMERAVVRRPDFAEVYRENVAPVWRYVRSRVPGHQEAQDVTSEVFARAWRSWGRYDAARGGVGAWLFRIAHRTVIDWLRQRARASRTRGAEGIEAMPWTGATPEEALLRADEVDLLRRAMNALNDRERDALALRFAGDLKLAEIADVLELSPPATKMLIWRAITKLRVYFLADEAPPEPAGEPVDLTRVLDTVMGRLHGVDPALDHMVAMLASAYEHDVPPKLPDRIAACVGCSRQLKRTRGTPPDVGPGKKTFTMAWHLGLIPFVGLGWALVAPACLVCVLPTLWPSLAGSVLGLAGVIDRVPNLGGDLVRHGIALALSPFVLIPLWFSYRRHRRPLPLLLGAVGATAMLIHLALHLESRFGVAEDVWRVSVKLGAGLIVAAVVINAIDMTRWVARQKRGLAVAVADASRPPVTSAAGRSAALGR